MEGYDMQTMAAEKQLWRTKRTWIDWMKAGCILLIIIDHTDTVETSVFFPLTVNMAVPVLMIITGINYTGSFARMNMSYREYYSFHNLSTRFKRIYFPYIPVFCVLTLKALLKGNLINPLYWAGCFFGGGLWCAPYQFTGSYYILVMAQTIICYPILYWLYKKWNLLGGGIILAVIVTASEIMYNAVSMTNDIYRLTALRYFPYIFAGIAFYNKFLSRSEEIGIGVCSLRRKLCHAVSVLAGVIWLEAIWFNFYMPLIFKNWTKTALPALLYLYPVMSLGIWLCIGIEKKMERSNSHIPVIGLAGRASYHIFLAQGMFFLVGSRIKEWLGRVILNPDLNHLLYMVIAAAFSISAGLLFYYSGRCFMKHIGKVKWIRR